MKYRFLSILLSLALLLSGTPFAFAAEVPPSDAEDTAYEQDDAVTSEETSPEPDDPVQTEAPSGDSELPVIEEESSEMETISSEAAPAEPEEEPEHTTKASGGSSIKKRVELDLSYDDHYSFSELAEGYVVSDIQSNRITSYTVVNGEKTATRDSAVLTLKENSETDVVATGIGTATVLLTPEDQTDSSTDTIQVNITVTAAKLTVMFLAGQSNMEGSCATDPGYHPEDSILCLEGQVYSTYLPRNTSTGQKITGISDLPAATTDNVNSFLPASLSGNTALSGDELIYPLDALTASGGGKTGPDSGLAYEWNRLTGEKVWLINTAWGGSSSSSWNQDGSNYTRSLTAYQAALQMLEAELSAGHYTEGHRLLFWLQGEGDGRSGMASSTYLSNFSSMCEGFQHACGIETFGILSVRAGSSDNTDELKMTTVRITQYYMANSTAYPDVYIVSNANESWTTDSGVQSYFSAAYPDGRVSYPLRDSTTLSALPDTVDAVHSDIHYAQIAHNENGLTAAREMYQIVSGETASDSIDVSWKDQSGASTTHLSLPVNQSTTLVPVVSPLSCSKQVVFPTNGTGWTYDLASGSLTATETGTLTISAQNSSGTTLSSVKISAYPFAAPELTSVANASSGVTVKWETVSGAAKYRVFRKTGSGNWSRVGDTTAASYTDKTVKSGTTYTYTVRCVSSDGQSYTSYFDTAGKTIQFLSAPELSSVSNSASGVTVKWKKVSGAVKYRVYHKTGSEGWTKVGDTTGTSYTDQSAESGTTYTYTVRCISNDGKSHTSSYDATGKTLKYLAQPAPSVSNTEKGVTIKWVKITGAGEYRVYRKTPKSDWSRIKTITNGSTVSYTDTTAANGTTYLYTVRACSGSTLSSYHSGKQIVRLSSSSISSLKNSSSKAMTVKWSKNAKAAGYQIQYSLSSTFASDNTTKTVSGASSVSKSISGLTKGKTYYVRVRSYTTVDKTNYYSAWSDKKSVKIAK